MNMDRYNSSKRSIIILVIIAIIAVIGMQSFADEAKREIFGTLTFPDGRPAPGVKIRYCGSSKCSTVVTDDKGNYKISLEAGTDAVGLGAQSGDYLLSSYVSFPTDSTMPVQKDLKLGYGALILGEVKDSATDKPVEDATIQISGSPGDSVKTGKDGVFSVKALPLSGLQIEVQKEGYVIYRQNFSAENLDTFAWRIKLKPGGVIRGKVTDENGKPVSGQGIEIYEDNYGRTVKSDQDGKYEIQNVDPDQPASLCVIDEGSSFRNQTAVEFPKNSTELVYDIQVNSNRNAARTISGKVTDQSGKLISDADVIFGKSTCFINAKTTRTDKDGKYNISTTSKEEDLLLFQKTSYAPTFMLVPKSVDAAIDAVLAPAHSATIKVTDMAGKPLSSVTVSVNAITPILAKLYGNDSQNMGVYRSLYNTTTDENGNGKLNDLPVDGIVLDIYKEGYITPYNIPIKVDSNDNVIKMSGVPQFAGKVVDEKTGKPITRFTVKWWMDRSYSSGGLDNIVISNTDGRFKIRVDDNRFTDYNLYQVKILADGYIGQVKQIKTTNSPKEDYSAVYKLKKTFANGGTVTDSSGKGIPGVKLTIIETHGYDYYESPPRISPNAYSKVIETERNGSFTIDSVFEESGIIVAEKPGYSRLELSDAIITKPLNIKIESAASLTIKAKRFGTEQAKIYMFNSKSENPSRQFTGTVPADGEINITDLAAGDYTIQIDSIKQSETHNVTLKSGQRKVIDLNDKPSVLLKGTVTSNSNPAPGITVAVNTPDYQFSASTTTDSQGKYELLVDKSRVVAITTRIHSYRQTLTKNAYLTVLLKNGENTFNFKLPFGTISGRLINKKTGEPVARHTVCAIKKKISQAPDYYNMWCMIYGDVWSMETISSARTESDGTFTLTSIPDCTAALYVTTESYQICSLGDTFAVRQNTPVTGVELKIPESGRLDLTVVDSITNKTVITDYAQLVNKSGVRLPVSGPAKLNDLPVGKYKLWVDPMDGKYMPGYAFVEIKPGSTTKVTFKVKSAAQRIMFKVAKGGRFENLKWPDKNPETLKSLSKSSMPINEIRIKDQPWIGYIIKDVVTGKPVITSSFGLLWGGCIRAFDNNREGAVLIKPGKYTIEAVMRNTEDYAVTSKANIWKIKKTITVNPGKDTIIPVQ